MIFPLYDLEIKKQIWISTFINFIQIYTSFLPHKQKLWKSLQLHHGLKWVNIFSKMFWGIFCCWRWTGGWLKQSTSPLYSHRNLFATLLIHVPSFSWDSSLQSCLWVIAGNSGDILPKCPKLWLKSGNGSSTVPLSGITELLGDSTFSSTSFVSFFFHFRLQILKFFFWNMKNLFSFGIFSSISIASCKVTTHQVL